MRYAITIAVLALAGCTVATPTPDDLAPPVVVDYPCDLDPPPIVVVDVWTVRWSGYIVDAGGAVEASGDGEAVLFSDDRAVFDLDAFALVEVEHFTDGAPRVDHVDYVGCDGDFDVTRTAVDPSGIAEFDAVIVAPSCVVELSEVKIVPAGYEG